MSECDQPSGVFLWGTICMLFSSIETLVLVVYLDFGRSSPSHHDQHHVGHITASDLPVWIHAIARSLDTHAFGAMFSHPVIELLVFAMTIAPRCQVPSIIAYVVLAYLHRCFSAKSTQSSSGIIMFSHLPSMSFSNMIPSSSNSCSRSCLVSIRSWCMIHKLVHMSYQS